MRAHLARLKTDNPNRQDDRCKNVTPRLRRILPVRLFGGLGHRFESRKPTSNTMTQTANEFHLKPNAPGRSAGARRTGAAIGRSVDRLARVGPARRSAGAAIGRSAGARRTGAAIAQTANVSFVTSAWPFCDARIRASRKGPTR